MYSTYMFKTKRNYFKRRKYIKIFKIFNLQQGTWSILKSN